MFIHLFIKFLDAHMSQKKPKINNILNFCTFKKHLMNKILGIPKKKNITYHINLFHRIFQTYESTPKIMNKYVLPIKKKIIIL